MSVVKKFFKFLVGGEKKKISKTEINALRRRIERQEKLLSQKREDLLLKARRLMKEGDKENARLIAKQIILLNRQIKTLRNMENFLMQRIFELEQAEMLRKIYEFTEKLIEYLREFQKAMPTKEFMRRLLELQKIGEKLGTQIELIEESMEELGEDELNEKAEELLERISPEKKLSEKELKKILEEIE